LIVAGQAALSLLLLIISAVLLQGFDEELHQGPGFRTEHLWLTSFDTQPIHYDEAQSRRFYTNLLEKTRLAPGVKSSALMSDVPFAAGGEDDGATHAVRRWAGRDGTSSRWPGWLRSAI
jgi:hypothetical protein